MTPMLRTTLRRLRTGRRAVLRLAAWSLLEALPAALSGIVVARAVDGGFLAHRLDVAMAWLAGMAVAIGLGAIGTRQVYRAVAELVEPLRDELVGRVVEAAVHRSSAPDGEPDSAALSRLTRQVETVRDAFAGLVLTARGFLVTVGAAMLGIASLSPVLVPLVLAPLAVGLALFAATLRMAVRWQREYLLVDERLAARATAVLGAARDVVACRAEERAATLADEPITTQATVERALARTAALRTALVGLAGWTPLVAVLAGATWLVGHGLTAGALLGAVTYIFQAMLPVLDTFVQTVGGGGLRYTVTMARIAAATAPPTVDAAPSTVAGTPEPEDGEAVDGAPPRTGGDAATGSALCLRGVTLRYGAAAMPVLDGVDLVVPPGDHLAIVGPSGAGKSTLVSVLCGTVRPDAGDVLCGGVPIARIPPRQLARRRVLIPQESYVFAGTVAENLTYLRPAATRAQVRAAIAALGAGPLVTALGGLDAELRPERLSPGQRQLIALVRAYLTSAAIIVLDEATGHLDAATEARVETAFAGRGGTLIVVAHRMSSALRAARVLVLDGGHATVGDHAQVLRDCPRYRDLLGYWWTGSEPAAAPGVADGFDPGTPAGLALDAREMVAHGADRQPQPASDLPRR